MSPAEQHYRSTRPAAVPIGSIAQPLRVKTDAACGTSHIGVPNRGPGAKLVRQDITPHHYTGLPSNQCGARRSQMVSATARRHASAGMVVDVAPTALCGKASACSPASTARSVQVIAQGVRAWSMLCELDFVWDPGATPPWVSPWSVSASAASTPSRTLKPHPSLR